MTVTIEQLDQQYSDLAQRAKALNINLKAEYEEGDPELQAIQDYIPPTQKTGKTTKQPKNSNNALAVSQQKQTQSKGALLAAKQQSTKAAISTARKDGTQTADQMGAAKLEAFLQRTADNEAQFADYILQAGSRLSEISDEVAQFDEDELGDFFEPQPKLTGMYAIDF